MSTGNLRLAFLVDPTVELKWISWLLIELSLHAGPFNALGFKIDCSEISRLP
jgi:hypothetical protein